MLIVAIEVFFYSQERFYFFEEFPFLYTTHYSFRLTQLYLLTLS